MCFALHVLLCRALLRSRVHTPCPPPPPPHRPVLLHPGPLIHTTAGTMTVSNLILRLSSTAVTALTSAMDLVGARLQNEGVCPTADPSP